MKLTSLDLPDSPEALEAITEELPEGVEVEEPWHGLKAWLNPINGFRVVRLHYSADPVKRTDEWRERERKAYGIKGSEWNREYELMWESLEGRPVYADYWDASFHVSRQPLGWNPKYPVCRGWDFGLNGACVFAQLFPHARLLILREAVSEDIGFERFVEEVARLSLDWFPGARFIEFIDPTGRNRFGSNEWTYSRILAGRPIGARRIIPGENAPAKRIQCVTDFLNSNVKGLPSYLVDPSCETLIKGYNGGYFYAYKRGTLKDAPEKNFFSHVHDANQYLCSKVLRVMLSASDSITSISEPRYGRRGPSELEKRVARA
jgi:hypothetical protein